MNIFASDFDKTLFFFDREGGISPEDCAAIRAFQEAGGAFGVCSGRSISGIHMSAGDKVRFDFYILSTGAQIFDADEKLIFEKTMTRETAQALYDACKDRTESVFHGRVKVYNLGRTHFRQIHIDSLEEMKDDVITSVSFAAASGKEAESIKNDINSQFGSLVTAFQNQSFIDVVPAGCSKGEALKLLKETMNASKSGGIGDSYNDVPLLKAADRAYTFISSSEEVREAADVVVESVAEALVDFAQGGGT